MSSGIAQSSAVAICDGCPCQSACLNYALTNNITDGIWGGKTERQRLLIRRSHSHEEAA